MNKLGFKFFRSGGFKLVYHHPDFPEYVFKVWKHEGSKDVEDWAEDIQRLPKPLRDKVLPLVFQSRYFFVQPKANGVGGNSLQALRVLEKLMGDEQLDNWDVRRANVRFHNGEPWIIDFAL